MADTEKLEVKQPEPEQGEQPQEGADGEQGDQAHIPGVEAPPEEEGPSKKAPTGLLSAIGDPLGSALGTGLKPLGAVVSTATKPVNDVVGGVVRPVTGPVVGEHKEKMEVLGGGNKDSYVHKKESLGGKEQTGDNPLGLDQTGRWGFRDEVEDGPLKGI